MADQDHLAYGDYQPRDEAVDGGDRGLVGDAVQKFQQNQGVTSFLNKVQSTVQDFRSGFDRLTGQNSDEHHASRGRHRFDSFVGPRNGNEVKWFVDGCRCAVYSLYRNAVITLNLATSGQSLWRWNRPESPSGF